MSQIESDLKYFFIYLVIIRVIQRHSVQNHEKTLKISEEMDHTQNRFKNTQNEQGESNMPYIFNFVADRVIVRASTCRNYSDKILQSFQAVKENNPKWPKIPLMVPSKVRQT